MNEEYRSQPGDTETGGVDLGAVDSFAVLPAEVTIDNDPYWLVRTEEGGYRLLMAICPHAGGDVRPMQGKLFCPLHFWTFSAESGACLNVPGEALMRREVAVVGDRLIASAL